MAKRSSNSVDLVRRSTRPSTTEPVSVFVVAETRSLNRRAHHMVHARHVKALRDLVALVLFSHSPVELPCRVTLTRCSPGTLDAHDNLRGALKPVVDELAAWLGVRRASGVVDDSLDSVEWVYAQEKTPRASKASPRAVPHGVRIDILHVPRGPA